MANAYSFGSGVTDKIDCGTTPGHDTSYSVAIRLKPHSVTGTRNYLRFGRPSDDHRNVYLNLYLTDIYAGHHYSTGGGGYHGVAWTHGWTADVAHVLVWTYDYVTAGGKLYADTDATPKATIPKGDGFPADVETDQHFIIGNDDTGGTDSAYADVYEVAWWPGTVLTGAQAAALGTGGAMAEGFPTPSNYWFVDPNASDLYGSADGTITGAGAITAVGTPWFAPTADLVYYVKTGGNDSLDGLSAGNAWATITKVNAVTLNPGDTVQFNGGDTFSGGLAPTISGGGAAANPVTFTSYGTGKATIQPAAAADGFYTTGVEGLEITNLIFQSSETPATWSTYNAGIHIEHARTAALAHIYIDGCEAYDFPMAGIVIYGHRTVSSNTWDDLRITNCTTTGNGYAGISIYGIFSLPTADRPITNAYVADCVSNDNPGTLSTDTPATLFGNGILVMGVSGGTIERCRTAGNGTNSDGGPCGIIVAACTGTVIQWNESYDTTSTGHYDGDGIDCDISATDCIVQYNYTHGNRAQGLFAYYSSGCIFRYNISENDNRLGDTGYVTAGALASAAPGTEWYGNTVYCTPGTGINPIGLALIGASTGVKVFNNIFITSGSSGRVLYVEAGAVTDTVINGNAYWQTSDTTAFRAFWSGTDYTTLAAFRTASSQETGTGHNLDPLLVAPGTGGTVGTATMAALRAGLTMYRPQSGSWVQGAGLDLDTYSITSPGTVDFFGLTLPTSGATTLGASLSAGVGDSDLLLLLAGHAEARA